jgi:hypothetical protein
MENLNFDSPKYDPLFNPIKRFKRKFHRFYKSLKADLWFLWTDIFTHLFFSFSKSNIHNDDK